MLFTRKNINRKNPTKRQVDFEMEEQNKFKQVKLVLLKHILLKISV